VIRAQEAGLGDAVPDTALSTPRSEFWAGVRATLPLEVGAIPFGIIFGAVAVNSGLSSGAAAALSAFVFAGSAQFIAAGLVAGGAGLAMIVLTTFVVNLRHALYSASLAPYLRGLGQRWLLPLGFWLTDESYVVTIEHYAHGAPSPHKHWYQLGSAVLMYANWQLWTWVGIWAGQSLPNPQAWGLDFALPVTFIGMLVPTIRQRSVLLSVLAAGAGALVFAGLPHMLGLPAAALLGVGVGVLAGRFDPPAGKEAA
jgi:4-azaleucine resistance transporter AzlC